MNDGKEKDEIIEYKVDDFADWELNWIEPNQYEFLNEFLNDFCHKLSRKEYVDEIQKPFNNAINEATEYGFVLALITDNYLNSFSCHVETLAVVDKEAIVIPLVFGDAIVPSELTNYQYYRIPSIPSDEDIYLIVELIEAALQRRIKGPIVQSYALNKLKEVNEKLNYEGRYHSQEAELISTSGSSDDYIEIYEFPCCGLKIAVGDGPVSRFRADGCCSKMNDKEKKD